MSRASGRTYRRVLNALYLASSGDKVLYVVSNQRMVTWTRERARELTDRLAGMDYKKSHSIIFPNLGSVEFVTVKKAGELRGTEKRHYKIVSDLDDWE